MLLRAVVRTEEILRHNEHVVRHFQLRVRQLFLHAQDHRFDVAKPVTHTAADLQQTYAVKPITRRVVVAESNRFGHLDRRKHRFRVSQPPRLGYISPARMIFHPSSNPPIRLRYPLDVGQRPIEDWHHDTGNPLRGVRCTLRSVIGVPDIFGLFVTLLVAFGTAAIGTHIQHLIDADRRAGQNFDGRHPEKIRVGAALANRQAGVDHRTNFLFRGHALGPFLKRLLADLVLSHQRKRVGKRNPDLGKVMPVNDARELGQRQPEAVGRRRRRDVAPFRLSDLDVVTGRNEVGRDQIYGVTSGITHHLVQGPGGDKHAGMVFRRTTSRFLSQHRDRLDEIDKRTRQIDARLLPVGGIPLVRAKIELRCFRGAGRGPNWL